MRLLAYEEAVGHYLKALRALEDAAPDWIDQGRRCDLLLALGEAARRAGDLDKAAGAFRRVADVAREHGFGERLARAALGLGGPWVSMGVVAREVMGLLEEAQRRLGDQDSVLRARVLARIAMELYFSDALERRARLSPDAPLAS